ncbi:hypothetical protein Sjap_018169 [Stephania japonica]|uniref:Uncharacterized protein n=1 Tax=Stephania japonica TaxID=461633 RepID=A0AAP0NKU4_9MAGN
MLGVRRKRGSREMSEDSVSLGGRRGGYSGGGELGGGYGGFGASGLGAYRVDKAVELRNELASRNPRKWSTRRVVVETHVFLFNGKAAMRAYQ